MYPFPMRQTLITLRVVFLLSSNFPPGCSSHRSSQLSIPTTMETNLLAHEPWRILSNHTKTIVRKVWKGLYVHLFIFGRHFHVATVVLSVRFLYVLDNVKYAVISYFMYLYMQISVGGLKHLIRVKRKCSLLIFHECLFVYNSCEFLLRRVLFCADMTQMCMIYCYLHLTNSLFFSIGLTF